MSPVDLGLQGRTFIVSGASRGLGRAAAQALLEEGANVVGFSRTGAPGFDTTRETMAGVGLMLAADLAATSTADRLVDVAMERFGRVDGLLVSSGGPPTGTALAAQEGEWQSAFETLVLGPLRLIRGTVTRLQPSSAIALIASSSVRAPLPNLGISNGLRPGIAMLAKTLADELGPAGIRVVTLVPGRILTERTLELERSDPGGIARSEAAIPLRRLGSPAEFGRVAAFVLSPAASYMTGSCVLVDGGMVRAL
jgi:3-oxoacyl-[acyl-carrier protein] reductase